MFPFQRNIILKGKKINGIKRSYSDYDSKYNLFQNYFGLHQTEAKNYIVKHKLDKIEPGTITQIIRFCEEQKFLKEDILKSPEILRVHPTLLDQRYNVMCEGGFVRITPKSLSMFRTLCRRNIYTLKELNLIHCQTNVAESFIQHLNPCPKEFAVEPTTDSDTWSTVHLKVLTNYLSWRLNVSMDDVFKFINIHKQVERKSFKYLCENIIFAEELGLPKEGILKYGYILRAYPKNWKKLLESFPEIVGVKIRKAMRMYPKLITASPASVQKIYKLLKDHEIPDEAMARHLNVFYLSPKTVEFRLNEIKRIYDLKVLRHNPNILKLVVHHNRAKSRLTFLKSLQLRCATVAVLGTDDQKFDNYIKEGKDINSYSDTYSFLEGTFKQKYCDFEAYLKKHPYYLLVPLTTMEDTYIFLRNEGFSNDTIYNVLHILLYPKEKLKIAFLQAMYYEKQSKLTLTQINKLNLSLYFIEKEHHFTGDGIWSKSEVSI